MVQYKARDGVPTDCHLVHLGERAKGGAGLVTTEMTCVTPEGRITPGCPGTYSRDAEAAWKRIVDFIHAETDAKVCLQLGHAGAKGSPRVGWEEINAPLKDGNWPILSASAVAWSPANQTPKAMERADMDRVRDAFVEGARMAERCGSDMIEPHMAHGYLLAAFTNRRTDEYGGSFENRMRYPLEIFRVVRAAWPEEKPISVRISAKDRVGAAGITPENAVEIARMLQAESVERSLDTIMARTGRGRGAAPGGESARPLHRPGRGGRGRALALQRRRPATRRSARSTPPSGRPTSTTRPTRPLSRPSRRRTAASPRSMPAKATTPPFWFLPPWPRRTWPITTPFMRR